MPKVEFLDDASPQEKLHLTFEKLAKEYLSS
jgi:hypothetical protein